VKNKNPEIFRFRGFLVREAGRRRRKLHIHRPAAGGRALPFRCGAFSHGKRFAGLPWEPCTSGFIHSTPD